MRAKAQKETIVLVARARSVASTMSTGGTAGTGGTVAGGNVGSSESGSVDIVRLGGIANPAPEEAEGKGRTAGDCGSTESGSGRIARLGSLAKGNIETRPETTETAVVVATAADGTAMTVTGATGGSDKRGSIGIVKLGSFARNVIETGVSATEETGGETVSGESGNNSQTAGEAGGVSVGKGGGTVQGGQAHLVRVGSFARCNTRIGRADHKLRRSQRHRRKAHHYLMSLTYSGLQPGMDYHIRVAGISSVGQVSRIVPGISFFLGMRMHRQGLRRSILVYALFGPLSGAVAVVNTRGHDTCEIISFTWGFEGVYLWLATHRRRGKKWGHNSLNTTLSYPVHG